MVTQREYFSGNEPNLLDPDIDALTSYDVMYVLYHSIWLYMLSLLVNRTVNDYRFLWRLSFFGDHLIVKITKLPAIQDLNCALDFIGEIVLRSQNTEVVSK